MSDWSISKRITALSGGIIVALVLTSLLAIASAFRLGGMFDTFSETSRQSVAASAIEVDIFQSRLAALFYRRTWDPEIAARAMQEKDNVGNTREETLAVFSGNPAMQAQLSEVYVLLDAYARAFDAMRAEEAAQFAAAERAEAAAETLLAGTSNLVSRSELSGSSAGTLAIEIGSAANNAVFSFRTFRASRTDDDAGAALALLATAREALQPMQAAQPALSAQLADIAAAMDRFEAEVAESRARNLARGDSAAELDRLGPQMQVRLDTVNSGVTEAQSALAVQGERLAAITLVVVLAVSAAAVVAAAVSAQRVGRGINASISRIVSETKDLASGNLDAEISGTDQKHELGELAKALLVFRDNARATKALEARQAEQQREQREAEEERARRTAEAEEQSRRQTTEARAKMLAELQSSIGSVVEGAASGDFSRRITVRFAEDEFNRMADGINRLMGNVETGMKEVVRVMSQVAAGDLTDRVSGNFAGLFADLQANVNDTIETLARVVDDIAAECDVVIEQVGKMTDQSNELARRAEQQAASLEETSAAMEEISASARSSAEGAASANEFATRATGRVDEAGRVVATAVEAMGDIRTASTRIGEIVSVIDGIAFQTNLLALNASVEAARAGSAGKGFAVVATEVRALAQRSSAASQDIKTLIDESAAQVSRGVGLVEETGVTLKEIVEGVRGMATAMSDLVTTGREQASGVQEVTTAITQLDVITQKNAALADQSRELSTGVKGRADAMRDLVGTFRTESTRRRTPGAGHRAEEEDDGWRAA